MAENGSAGAAPASYFKPKNAGWKPALPVPGCLPQCCLDRAGPLRGCAVAVTPNCSAGVPAGSFFKLKPADRKPALLLVRRAITAPLPPHP
jgi:hypothetical protein